MTSLDTTVNSNFTVGGVTFTTQDLDFAYTASGSQFSLSGTATVAVTNLGTLNVTFGHGTTPGLVVTNGALTSLDTTVNSNFTVGGITFTAQNLDFSYTASNSQFSLSGSASVAVTNLGTLNVTFGHGTTPGLVVTNGALTSLDTTVNSTFTVAGVTLTAQDLDFSYTAANSQFGLSGAASVAVTNLGTLSVTFGHGTTPGLVVTNGALTSLDMTVNSTFTVSGVTFTAQNLEFAYTASGSQFSLSGTASVAVSKLGTLSVTFGHGTTPGLVVTNGSLTSLDTTVNSTFTVAGVTFTTQNLEFAYTAANSLFSMSGTASLNVQGIGSFSVTFGHNSNPGLVVQNGSLVSLDVTLNSSITIAAVAFSTTGLEFTYVSATSLFTLSGTAGVSVQGIGNLSVTFGHNGSPGLVIQNGSLVSMDLTVNSDITIGAVNISTTGLEFTYVTATSLFTLSGTAGVSVKGIDSFSVTFGHNGNPGLVIQNGSLVSLDVTINSNIQIGAVTFSTTGLEFTYVAATDLFTLSGTAGVSIKGIDNFSVTFGHNGNPRFGDPERLTRQPGRDHQLHHSDRCGHLQHDGFGIYLRQRQRLVHLERHRWRERQGYRQLQRNLWTQR